MRRTNFAVHFLRAGWWRVLDAAVGPGGLVDAVAPQSRLAWRNILRQRRRTAAALAAVAFGVIALIVAGSFIDWILWATRETTIHSHLGHVQVTNKGFQTNGVADPFSYLPTVLAREQGSALRVDLLFLTYSRPGRAGSAT